MYSFVVFLHVFGALMFLLAHGVSIVVFLMLRRQPSVERTRVLMSLRNMISPVMMVAFLVTILAGVAAAFIGSWWSRGWVWASIGVLIVIFVAMGLLGREYFERIQRMLKPPAQALAAAAPASVRTQELAPILRNSHPRILSAIGIGGLVIILYLMMFKPF